MQTKIITATALFSVAVYAQDKQSSLEKTFYDLLTSVDNSPQVSTALSVFATALPSSYVKAISSDPASFYEQLATATTLPTEVSNAINAIPTAAASYIVSAVSKGADIVVSEDSIYASSVINDPKWTSALSVLNTAVPSSVQSLLASNDAYALSILTATSLPSWASALPTDAVNYLNSIDNDAISIDSANVNGFSSTPYPNGATTTTKPSSGFAKATSGVAKASGSVNGTGVATFKGAASSVKTGGIGAGALFAAIALWFHV